jgi:glutathione S-transferase
MRLYVFPVAPNPTRVRLYLAEKKIAGARIDLEEVNVDLREGQQPQPRTWRNPFGRLPVLESRTARTSPDFAIIQYRRSCTRTRR